MRRNLILVLAIALSLLLVYNSGQRILSLKTTSGKVVEAEVRLENLKQENEELKRDLEYKKGEEFKEVEIRNKLGLAKEGEAVVIIENEEEDLEPEANNKRSGSNWKKWWELFFGT